jgi:predicted transcriptional regulator
MDDIIDRVGDSMATTVEVPLSDEARERLKEIAARTRRTEQETAATLIEGALAADEVEVEILRRRLSQADAGGPFARHEDVLAWLQTLSEGKKGPPPEATITD